MIRVFNITICQDGCVGIIALCSFVGGGTGWRLAERVVQPYLPSEGGQEEPASKIKLLRVISTAWPVGSHYRTAPLRCVLSFSDTPPSYATSHHLIISTPFLVI